MNQVIITKDEYGYYSYKYGSNNYMKILGFFLTSDVTGSAENWKQWALGPQPFTSSNFCSLSRVNNVINIDAMYFEEWGELEITVDQFLSLLDQWEKLYEEKPQEIVITIDDHGNVAMEGRN